MPRKNAGEDRRDEERAHPGAPQRAAEGGGDRVAVAARLVPLGRERLHHPHPHDRLLGAGVGGRQLVLEGGADAPEAPAEDGGRDDDRRQDGQHDEGQAGVDHEQHDDAADERHRLRHQLDQHVADGALDRGDVGGEARGDLARLAGLEEADREREQVLEHRAAQVGDHALADVGELVDADVRGHGVEDEDDQDHGAMRSRSAAVAAPRPPVRRRSPRRRRPTPRRPVAQPSARGRPCRRRC
jgi:hypothetical protein